MQIALVTTWDTECGIATYSRDLSNAITKAGSKTVILSEHKFDGQLPSKNDQSFRIWNRFKFSGEAFARNILDSKITPNIVHFQHEFGLFPNNQELLTALELLAQKIPVVITLHTILDPPHKTEFFKNLNRCRVISHTNSGAAILHSHTLDDQSLSIHVIPHGLTFQTVAGIKKNHYFLCPGFISPSKGHLEIIEAYAQYCFLGGRKKLKLLGLCRDYDYLTKLNNEIQKFGLEDSINIDSKFCSTMDLIEAIYHANAVILGNGKGSPYSASGQLHTALGIGTAIIAKNVPIYNNLPVALYNNASELTNLMLGAESLGDSLELDLIAKTRTWDVIAQKHLDLYKSIL